MNSIDIIKDEIIYLKNNNAVIYNINAPVTVKIFHYSINSNAKVTINLNRENAEIEYHYSTFNVDDHRFSLNINHNVSKTKSNVYNHGVNLKDNKLIFDITSTVLKNSSNSICNQENQIINLNNGYSKINPNLLIDNYDVSSSHAAYIGVFREELIFYLMSRGISRNEAINLLIQGLLINGGNKDESIIQEFLINLKEVQNG